MTKMNPKWKARLLSAAVGIAFFCIYAATLHDGFFPGEAARQVSVAMRMEAGRSSTQFRQVREQLHKLYEDEPGAVSISVADNVVRFSTKYVLWRMAGMAVSSVPVGGLAKRMNLFSALCASIALTLAFATARALLLFLSFHVCPLSGRRRKNAAFFSALAGVMALGFSVPFWISATRFLPNAFESMLLLLAAWLILKAAVHHLEWPLFFFGLLVGLTTFETETGAYMLPVWIFFAVRAMLVGDLSDARGWSCLLIGMVVGVIGYIGLSQILLAREGIGLFEPIKELFSSAKVFGNLLIGGSLFEDQSRLINLCFAIIPFFAAAAMSIWRSNEDAASSGGFLLFVLACMVAVGLSNLKISPWGAAPESNGAILQTNVYLLIAYVASYLTGQGLLMAGGRFFSRTFTKKRHARVQYAEDDEGDVRAEEHRDYPVGRILSAFVLALCMLMALVNWRIVSDWSDSMSDLVAREIVDRSGPCTWFASERDILDSHVRVHAREARKRLAVISTSQTENVLPRLARAITRDPAFAGLPTAELRNALISTNTDLFMTSWIKIDPEIDRKLMTADSGIWRDAGRKPVPFVVGYKTIPEGAEPDWAALATAHLEFWSMIDNVPALGPRAPHWLRMERAALRRRLSDIGRELASNLSAASKTDLAREVLEKATAIRDDPVADKGSYDPYDIY